MFGKKPEKATQDEVMDLIGSKRTTTKADTGKTQQQSIQDYNNQVQANKQGNAIADQVAQFSEQIKAGANALLGQVHQDSESNGNPAPKGFFRQISSKNGYDPEIKVITAYLFKHWHEQAGNMVQGNDIDPLIEACVELKKYIEAQQQAHILKEFTGYYLTALVVNYAMFLTKDFPAKRDMVLEKLLAVEKLCKKLMHIPVAEPRQQTTATKAPAQGNPLDSIFVSSVKNFGTSIEQVMHDMKEHEAQHFYAQDKATFIKLANYCYLILLNLKMAMNAGKEVEFNFDAHEALEILKASPSFKEVEAADFSMAVLNVVFSVFLRWDTQDLTAQQRLGILQMGGPLLKTVGKAVHDLVIGEARVTAAEGMKSSGLSWFDECGIEELAFFALKASANNFYNADLAQGSKIYNNHLPQLGEIGKTPFGKAMFYAGMGMIHVVNNGGIQTAVHVLPAFNLIADWIAEQPNKDDLFKYMNVPASILNSAKGKDKGFDEAYDQFVEYTTNKLNEPTQGMHDLMAAMEKLQEGLEQIPGIDPKDLAELRTNLEKGKEQFNMASERATAPQAAPTTQPQEKPADAAMRAYEQILNSAMRFANLKLYKTIENIQQLGTVGIAASEFEPNKDETAPFNFLVQFAALAYELDKFRKEFDPDHLDDHEDEQAHTKAENFIYWLAANLFKLNLHMAADPFQIFKGPDSEMVMQTTNGMLGVLGVDQTAGSALANVFNSFRIISAKMYGAFLENEEPHKVLQGEITDMQSQLESLGNIAQYVGTAFVIALGYQAILFKIGTTKKLHENIEAQFSVERGENGYKLKTLAVAFGKRFRQFAGAYGQWHIVEDNSIWKESDIGDFKPNEKVLLTLDKTFIATINPNERLAIKLLGNPISFFGKLSGYMEQHGYQQTMVAFPIL